jgi:DNA polymerase bacteriophage-type
VSKYLFPDYETFSALDIKHVSTDRYAAHGSTRALMCAFAFDAGPVELWQEGESGLDALKRDLQTHVVVPWNASFEKAISKHVWKLSGITWRDAMVASLYAGFPAGLKDCVKLPFFKNEAESTKEALLINKFCKPQKDGGTKNKETDPEDWDAFCDYCRRDVQGTRVVWQWLQELIPTPEDIWKQWEIDQRINERGMPIDRMLTYRAWEEAQRLQIREAGRLKELTGLDNPNSTAQLLPWLRERGYPYTSLGKELVQKALDEEPDGEGVDTDDDE